MAQRSGAGWRRPALRHRLASHRRTELSLRQAGARLRPGVEHRASHRRGGLRHRAGAVRRRRARGCGCALELARGARPISHYRRGRRDRPRPAERAGAACCRPRGDAASARESSLSHRGELRRFRAGQRPRPAGLPSRAGQLDRLDHRAGGFFAGQARLTRAGRIFLRAFATNSAEPHPIR